jgi:iron complex outermembrane receptor protein
MPDLKLIGGLRWTDDQKHFTDIPSELLVNGYGYPVTGVVNQQWDQWTGRAAVNWTPKLDFTDQTLVYGSYSHGYKAGGANPPGAVLLSYTSTDISNPIHPLTFKPEFVDAFELGSKNTLLDGALTLNGDVFYYNYKSYQISRIVDRTAINDNFDAHIKGAELETTWEPLPGLKFNFAGGYEDARAAKGDHSVDLMDRTAGNPDWMVLKPFVTQASNCILPKYVIAAYLNTPDFYSTGDLVSVNEFGQLCAIAYGEHIDPVTMLPYVADPTESKRFGSNDSIGISFPYLPPGYIGFDPTAAPNNGQGFDKNLSGNQLPNSPHFTTSFSAEYTMPVSEDWAATLHGDFYWQSQSYARIFNDRPYDKLRGYSSTNLAMILTSASGWQVMGYLKNIFNTTAITGDFLNSDDSGLTTNVFLTDPRLYGVRVTKNF